MPSREILNDFVYMMRSSPLPVRLIFKQWVILGLSFIHEIDWSEEKTSLISRTKMLQNLHLVGLVLAITVLQCVSALPTSPPSTTKPPYLFDSQESPQWSSSEEDAWYNYVEEEQCEPGQFWHIRGRRCVPHKCPRANWMRNWKTGECLYTDEGEVKPVTTRRPLKMTMFKPNHPKSFRNRPKWVEVQKKTRLDQDIPTKTRTL